MRDAAAQGIALVFPDTSPRGAGIEGEDENWDFGTGGPYYLPQLSKSAITYHTLPHVGAGFYLNATNVKYSRHYNMLTHVTMELPQTIEIAGLPIVSKPLYCLRFSSAYSPPRTLNASLSLVTRWEDMAH
jgi:S-formylglutathione hydrolase